MQKKKAFQAASEEDVQRYFEEGKNIFLALNEKYVQDTSENIDSILNSLAAAFYLFLKARIDEDDQRQILHILYQILTRSLNEY